MKYITSCILSLTKKVAGADTKAMLENMTALGNLHLLNVHLLINKGAGAGGGGGWRDEGGGIAWSLYNVY